MSIAQGLEMMSPLPPVNPNQDNSLLQIVPCPPVRTSERFSWTGIQVQHHQPPAWENAEHFMTQHVVVVHHSGQTVQSERMLGDRKQEEQLDNGQIVIVPAGVPHKLRWNGAGNFTLLMLEPSHFANVAYEAMDVDRVEVIPQFAMFDPMIYQIGLALKLQMETDVNDRLYAESMTALLGAHLLRHYSTWEKPLQPYKGDMPKRQLWLVMDYIQTHLMDDLSLETLASLVQMSPFYFTRLFKQSTGMTPHRYVQHQRVEKAKELKRQRNY